MARSARSQAARVVGTEERVMQKLSTGHDSTLGNYLALTLQTFGEGPAAEYLRNLIAKYPNGENEEVLQPESQMLMLLGTIDMGEPT
jgi:hypothetical protein